MICVNCKNSTFTIERIPECSECKFNGAWLDGADEWTYDAELITKYNFIREEVQDNGECRFGSAYGGGCYLIRCSQCNTLCEHIAMIED